MCVQLDIYLVILVVDIYRIWNKPEEVEKMEKIVGFRLVYERRGEKE